MQGWVLGLISGDWTKEQRNAVSAFLLWAIIIVHVAWACGLLPGTNGFAFADDVDEKIAAAVAPIQTQMAKFSESQARLESRVIQAQIATMEKALFDLRRSHCEAIVNENREAIEFFGRNLQTTIREFYDTTGREHRPPTCAEMGVK